MAKTASTTFRPPAEWPNAKIEQALDTGHEKLGTLAAFVDGIYPKDDEAAALKREALAHLRKAKELLFRSRHAEMEARLRLWRGLGYRL